VKDLPYFKDMQPNLRNDIMQFFEVIELKPGDLLFKDDPSSPVSVYILVTGKLKKSIHAPWNQYKVRLLVDTTS